jgi:hypothetical protein
MTGTALTGFAPFNELLLLPALWVVERLLWLPALLELFGNLLRLPFVLLAFSNFDHTWLSFFLLISWYNFKTSITA